jgi:hypothetical protein
MLDTLQRTLSDIYDLGPGYDVRDFLITDPMMAKALGQGAVLGDSEETLLMLQEGDDLSLSLFLDGEMLARLESGKPLDHLHAEMLGDLWKVMEGISHFNCVVWKAMQDRPVTLLELELQGEIDKYVSTMLLATAQSDKTLLRNLHGWLFDNVSFHDELDDEQRDRYRAANDYAARYCYDLQKTLIENDELAFEKLRRFYRLQMGEKISHIHAQALARS